MAQLGKPLRIALFGVSSGASLDAALEILGLDEAKIRTNLLAKCVK
ncbi:MAG: hypothetical protein LBO72_06185 [Helicobacteraceae bacterium]|jgi:hypothetical protein|nr:hypothetical protein [Helicobacteraceae bacterium]